MPAIKRRILLVVPIATLVAVVVTTVAASGSAPTVPWILVFSVTATFLAVLGRVLFDVGRRIDRIIGVFGMVIAAGYAILMVLAFTTTDPVLAGGLVTIPYLVMQPLMPLVAAAVSAWGLYSSLHRVRDA